MEELDYFSQEAPEEHFERLKKDSLKTFFADLHRSLHFVYALAEQLPRDRFTIELSYDYKQDRNDLLGVEKFGNFSLKEFCQNYGKFHKHDEFRILFGGKILRYRNELSDRTMLRLYENELRDLCEERLRRNDPVSLTNQPLCDCSLSRFEAEIIGQSIEIYNSDLIRKIQSEFDALKNLDFIVK